MEINIYYESLTYKDITQVPSYDLFSLLGKRSTVDDGDDSGGDNDDMIVMKKNKIKVMIIGQLSYVL